MDFSSHNPASTNALNLAARNNDTQSVIRFLKKINPANIDNRGWTCLHEAADNDSYESLKIILKHPDCRPLAETHEGHTALYLAIRSKSSMKTIKALLESVEDIVNYGSTEGVTPLHLACHGQLDIIDLLIHYGAIIDVQDFDGDTPLHDAALETHHSVITSLLHAGANPNIPNTLGLTPLHLACMKGSFLSVKSLLPFLTDINRVTDVGDSPLMLAVHGGNDDTVKLLLKNGADLTIINGYGENALDIALRVGCSSIFSHLLALAKEDDINLNIILNACKPHFFKLEILESLLTSDIGPDFFSFHEKFYVCLEQIGDLKPVYHTNAVLNSFLHISSYLFNHSLEKFQEFFYLFLMRGVSVNAKHIGECPPLVYLHYCVHQDCFEEVFKILVDNGCYVDYCSALSCLHTDRCLPDAFVASLSSNPTTLPLMLLYSLNCEPDYLLHFAYNNDVLGRIPISVQNQLLSMIDSRLEGISAENLSFHVPCLKHLSRLTIRKLLRNRIGIVKSTIEILNIINSLPVPLIIKNYLRYRA